MEFERFSREIADALMSSTHAARGLPAYLGINVESVEPGVMRASLQAREELLNPFGSLHGGVIAAFVDHVLGAVLYPVIEPGAWAATTEFKLNYVAPVRDGSVTAEATILSLTKRTAVVRIDVHAGERLVCCAQGTVLIAPPR
jgi:uncharacterized protein (TIGR00369 family)